MKGVSAIIATILLLMITIGLAGTAYVYISGMMTTKMAKAISIMDANCKANAAGTNVITIVVSNDGTDPITNSGVSNDLKILVDNSDKSDIFKESASGSVDYTINPHAVVVLLDDITNYPSGAHRVLILSPSNSITQTIWC